MSKRSLSKQRLELMQEVLTGYIERGELPGFVTVVSRGEEVHVNGVGTLGLDNNRTMQPDTIFRIASMTKPVVAVAAMILVEECKLRLDEALDGFLPELANRQVLKHLDSPLEDTVPAHRSITLRDLLTFRLGWGILMAPPGSYPIQEAFSDKLLGQGPPSPLSYAAPDEWLHRLGKLPLMHQPGERWLYNTGSDVLGVLIARVIGQPLETFLHERIFEPLGMQDTSFSVPPAKLHRLATSYSTNFETGALEVYDQPEASQWSSPPRFPSGSGGLVSTATDYLAFGQMLLNKGSYAGGRILARPSIELMTTDKLTPAQKALSGLVDGYFDNHGWGFGMSVVTKRRDLADTVGKFGWDGGLGTSWYTDPQEEMVTILLTQKAWTSPTPPSICLDFWTLAYQAIDN